MDIVTTDVPTPLSIENDKARIESAKAKAKADYEAAKAKRLDRIKQLCTPGDHPEGCSDPDVRPCGKADGVVFLGEGREANELPDGNIEVKIVKSLKREAFRYLHPMPALWRALNNGKVGVCTPHGVEVLFTKDMFEAEKSTGRKLHYMFASDDHGITAAHPIHRQLADNAIIDPDSPPTGREAWRWKVVKVQEGIWVFLYE